MSPSRPLATGSPYLGLLYAILQYITYKSFAILAGCLNDSKSSNYQHEKAVVFLLLLFFISLHSLESYKPFKLHKFTVFITSNLFQGRLFSYSDTHRHRLGANYHQIPVNCTYAIRTRNYQWDGPMTGWQPR